MVELAIKDHGVASFPEGSTFLDIAKSVGVANKSYTCIFNGDTKDLRLEVPGDGTLSFAGFDEAVGKGAFWHTSSHIMAQAVKRILPDVKVAIGPSIENGFYYDFDTETIFTPEIIAQIEAEMEKIIKENPKIVRYTLSRDEALKKCREAGEPYKVELIEGLAEDAVISFYEQGEFWDLCAGPHILSMSPIKAVKILSVAGAYWRGDEKNKMLQRLYAISFPEKKMLEDYLFQVEEAKKRDHRKLGRELDLFSVMEEGPGFPFFHPRGMIIRNELENFWRKEHEKRGYEEIKTPIILDAELWKRSGHWDHYKDNMYFTNIDEREFAVKPMNCPGAMLLFNRKLHSYRDLPVRMGELGLVHRHEKSGALHGLMRVRNFTQDDAHIFCTPEQISPEVNGVIDLIDYVYSIFGFKYTIELSTMPEDHIGTLEEWKVAEDKLKSVLDERGTPYKINEGDGAFYGPKIDFHLRDSIGRTWQCGTIQLDMQMPERFDLYYVGDDGAKHRPSVLHRVVFGSVERFIAVLTEHFAADFPLWLAPQQTIVLSVNEPQNEYANSVAEQLKAAGIRATADTRREKLGLKIREAELMKIPYMLVVGPREAEDGAVSVRSKKRGDLGTSIVCDIIKSLSEEIETKLT